MTKTERIAALEAKVVALEARVQATEAAAFRRFLPTYPSPYPSPYTSPYTTPYYWTYPGGWGVVTSGLTGTITTGSTTAHDHNIGAFTLSNGTNMVSQ